MGSDNLFHKRRQRSKDSLRRKNGQRAPYDRVLIICEGAKTEPNYLKEIRDDYRLTTANIEILGKECGSDPLSVINYAIQRFNKDKGYNRVYCVVDRDKHATFNDAMDKLRRTRLGKEITFKAIVSVPCFEYWLLLHFAYTTQQFVAPANDSNCALVVAALDNVKFIPGYNKGATGIFSLTKAKLPEAINNAKKVQKYSRETGSTNPSTNVYELIEYLINLNS